jgi:hypothetical protein
MAAAPDALLFIAPGCPHCPVVLGGLAELVKVGVIGRLEVVNVAEHPEQAAALGVRAAPWTRIGPFVLEGAQTPKALQEWAERAALDEGGTEYLRQLLGSGRLGEAEAYIAGSGRLRDLLPFIEDPEAPIQVRLGANAILEAQAGRDTLADLIPQLGSLSMHPDHRVRSDACHLLGLSGNPEAEPFLRERLVDESDEVREIAGEAVETLGEAGR